MRERRDAVLISHDAVFGDRTYAVGKFKVSDVKPFAHYERSVSISWMTPRARKRSWSITVVPNNMLFYTIERDGDVLYDSRSDVPCDMDEFARKKSQREARAYATGMLGSVEQSWAPNGRSAARLQH